MTKVALDYEGKKSYSVTVNATDPSGTSASANNRVRVTINLVHVSRSPGNHGWRHHDQGG